MANKAFANRLDNLNVNLLGHGDSYQPQGNLDIKGKYPDLYDYLTKVKENGLFTDAVFERHRIEPRTRKKDSSTALSFGVHDPLWLLTRQWQFGEFKGNDCGSPVLAKIKMKKDHFQTVKIGNTAETYSRENAMEYQVERMNVEITPLVRIESALHLKRMLHKAGVANEGKILDQLLSKYPLEPFAANKNLDLTTETNGQLFLEETQKRANARLEQYWATYGKQIFDGYKIYSAQAELLHEFFSISTIIQDYCVWFKERYLPTDKQNKCWSDEQLGYDFSVEVVKDGSVGEFSVEDYHSGKLSWYSFDKSPNLTSSNQILASEEKLFTFLPTPARYPGAPAKRLWQFEDAKVYMGDSDMDFTSVGNALVMQFATMYGNDWMIIPMELEVGTAQAIEGIVITDTFGQRFVIDRPAGETVGGNVPYSKRWEMFGITNRDAYLKKDFSADKRLIYPPSLARAEESKPVEEIQFLRDEMSNMLWGVETLINDHCGKTLKGDEFASSVIAAIDDFRKEHAQEITEEENEAIAQYAYLMQNRVPLNWIPFIPQKFQVGTPNFEREIRFRRATMPLFINNDYQKVRPLTSLLAIRKEAGSGKIIPRYVNEEEILAVGTKVDLTYQRTRWFNGKTFNWLGAKKEISRTQGNSGLLFDELIEKLTKNNIIIDTSKENNL